MNNVKTKHGLKIIVNRANKNTPDYSPPSLYALGQDQGVISDSTEEFSVPIPLNDGTVVDDCSTAYTGSLGGTTSTDNIVIFKPGANQSDNTAQNLLANDTDTSKVWTKSGLTISPAKFFGLNLYIADTETLAIFTSVEIRLKLASEAADIYYYRNILNTELSTGWNWIYIEDITDLQEGAGGAPTALDTLIVVIETPLATDIWNSGNIVLDLVRQWEQSDVYKTIMTDYPVIDEINMTSTYQMKIYSTDAVGFSPNVVGLSDTISPGTLTDIHLFAPDGKSDTEEIIFEIIDTYKQG